MNLLPDLIAVEESWYIIWQIYLLKFVGSLELVNCAPELDKRLFLFMMVLSTMVIS